MLQTQLIAGCMPVKAHTVCWRLSRPCWLDSACDSCSSLSMQFFVLEYVIMSHVALKVRVNEELIARLL